MMPADTLDAPWEADGSAPWEDPWDISADAVENESSQVEPSELWSRAAAAGIILRPAASSTQSQSPYSGATILRHDSPYNTPSRPDTGPSDAPAPSDFSNRPVVWAGGASLASPIETVSASGSERRRELFSYLDQLEQEDSAIAQWEADGEALQSREGAAAKELSVDGEQVQRVIADAIRAAAQLRDGGLDREADKMDAMVAKLQQQQTQLSSGTEQHTEQHTEQQLPSGTKQHTQQQLPSSSKQDTQQQLPSNQCSTLIEQQREVASAVFDAVDLVNPSLRCHHL